MGRIKTPDVIVLLPGITGSVLQHNGKDVWAPSAGAAIKALWTLGRSIRELTIDDDPVDRDDLGDGVVATRLVPDAHIVPGLWGIDGYSGISAMITGTFDVVPGRTYLEFPYDWRRDNRVSARKLAQMALPALHERRKVEPDAKLVLIGHSMGGLVARYFLECLDGWKDTRTLITFGTPYRGSLNAVYFIANGFAKKVGPFKVDLTSLITSFTSVYQLLPIYPCVDLGQARGGLVRPAHAEGVPRLDLLRAEGAEHDFHRAIERAVEKRDVVEPYAIHPVVGITQPTFQSAQVRDGRVRMLRSHDGEDHGGDGTVPRPSATPIELDASAVDRAVYASERHATLQNVRSVQTQVRGLLTPVDRPERFRDARGGLGLLLDDLYIAGEEVPVQVTASTRRVQLVATVVDLATNRPVVGPVPLTAEDDTVTHTAVVPPLPAGAYRLEVDGAGGTAGSLQSVSDIFLVADDEEPDPDAT